MDNKKHDKLRNLKRLKTNSDSKIDFVSDIKLRLTGYWQVGVETTDDYLMRKARVFSRY